jgi:hypothetical protein
VSVVANMLVSAAANQRGTKTAAKQKGAKTALKKSVTPARYSTSATPGSSRHSTPHHSISDDYTSPRNPTHSTRRESMSRSSASPGILMLNILELHSFCPLRYT